MNEITLELSLRKPTTATSTPTEQRLFAVKVVLIDRAMDLSF